MWNMPGVVPGSYEGTRSHGSPSAIFDKKIFFVGTENPQVLLDAKAWAQQMGIVVSISKITEDILLSKRKKIKTQSGMHDLQYFSYIVNLHNILRCDAIICTYPSNYCRVIDELRATVGGKANRYFADVSVETCKSIEGPPCILRNGNISVTPMIW